MQSIIHNGRAISHKKVRKPENLTWEQYAYQLLGEVSAQDSIKYLTKLNKSKEFWATSGGYLDEETINNVKRKIKEPGYTHIKTANGVQKNYRTNKNKKPLIISDYLDDIDDPHFMSLPTYKRFCIAILKGDVGCKTMGF